jgi:UDP-N-acetylmuramoyl-L-alanyl-D-glutamate--2,6-diaminopimelate ligase
LFDFDNMLTFGLSSNASVTAQWILEEKDQTTCEVAYLWETYQLKTSLVGRYNIANILAALSVTALMWVDMAKAIASVAEVEWVLGRMDSLDHEGVRYFVDYAHTEDALDKTLQYLTSIKADWRLIALSGSMWDGRDKGKRPIMGALLDKYADIVVLADEDPGHENRLWIIQDLVDGMTEKKHWEGLFVLPERHYAIQFITDIVKEGDTVFLAGKWHEEVMVTMWGRRDWNDRRELESCLGIEK